MNFLRNDFFGFLSSYKEEKIIVSLTSYPARIRTVHKTIWSLLNQSQKVDKIILWLSKEEFPKQEKDIPPELLKLKNFGLIIDWCNNIGPYKKLIPTLKKYPDYIIITADDDVIYAKDSIKNLYDEFQNNRKCIVCNRGHYITFQNDNITPYNEWIMKPLNYEYASFRFFPTGCSGILYFPNCFYKDIFNESLFMKLCQNTDDIWFWSMAVLQGIKIKLAGLGFRRLNLIKDTQTNALCIKNKKQTNDANLKLMFDYYPQLLNKLRQENAENDSIYKM